MADARSADTPREIVRELLTVAQAVRKRVRRGLIERGHDLHPSHTAVIPNLPPEGLRLTELAERLGMSVQRAGQLLAHLEQAGYVERTVDPTDGRARLVRPSARGRRLMRDSAELNAELWQELRDELGAARLAAFAASLADLHETLVGGDSPLLLEPAAPPPRTRKRLRRARG